MIIENDLFDIEILRDGVGDIMLYISVEGIEGTESATKVLSKEELRKIIDDLEKIYKEEKWKLN